MSCDACDSERILQLTIKCSDRCHATFNGVSKSGYAPDVVDVCGGDYARPDICLECGKVQGSFPVQDPEGFFRIECSECGGTPAEWRPRGEGDACQHEECSGYYFRPLE